MVRTSDESLNMDTFARTSDESLNMDAMARTSDESLDIDKMVRTSDESLNIDTFARTSDAQHVLQVQKEHERPSRSPQLQPKISAAASARVVERFLWQLETNPLAWCLPFCLAFLLACLPFLCLLCLPVPLPKFIPIPSEEVMVLGVGP